MHAHSNGYFYYIFLQNYAVSQGMKLKPSTTEKEINPKPKENKKEKVMTYNQFKVVHNFHLADISNFPPLHKVAFQKTTIKLITNG